MRFFGRFSMTASRSTRLPCAFAIVLVFSSTAAVRIEGSP
jgi:hypothetical protein